MPNFQIIEAKSHHCGQMARRLFTEGDPLAISLGAAQTHREMRVCFDGSWYVRAWLIGDKVAALGGVIGQSLSTRGYLWFVLSDLGRRHRVALVKMLLAQINNLKEIHPELILTVTDDSASQARNARFAGFLGFQQVPGTTRVGLLRHKALTFRHREAA